MKAQRDYFLEQIRTSFLVIPGLMTAVAVGVAILTAEIDRAFEHNVPPALFLRLSPDGARAVLATIAGSIASVGSVVFSLMLVALTLASSQLGPRLLRNFFTDRVTQVVLGAFLSTFIYSLLVLGAVSQAQDRPFVPHLSVTLALLLAVLSFTWLIYFIHHLAHAIQADSVIAHVAAELRDEFADLLRDDALGTEALRQTLPPNFTAEAQTLTAQTTGYIQAIDYDTLLELATKHDAIIHMTHRPGHFIVQGGPFAEVAPATVATPDFEAAAWSSVVTGPRRTPTQDIEYSIEALVQVAMRALSSAINDPITAIVCIDHLTGALAEMMPHEVPSRHRCDEEGKLRLVRYPSTFADILAAGFNIIRQQAISNPPVMLRLVENLTVLAEHARTAEQRAAIELQQRGVEESVLKMHLVAADREALDQRLTRLHAALAHEDESSPRRLEAGARAPRR